MNKSTERAKRFVRLATEGLSNREIADEEGVSPTTVGRVLKDAGFTRHLLPTHNPAMADRFELLLEQPIVVKETPITITADWHVPLYDPYYVNFMIMKSREMGITTLGIGGDFWNFDSLSQYDPKQDEAHLWREYEEGIKVMRTLLETFDEIVYVWGNHDARLHKQLGYKLRFNQAMNIMFDSLGRDALNRIKFSNLDYFLVSNGGYDYRVCHPGTYSRLSLSVPNKLSMKYNTSVISAHGHHCAVGISDCGKHLVAEAGGMFDPAKTEYLQRSTTFPVWNQGFAIVDGEGYLSMHSPRFETMERGSRAWINT